MMLSHLLLFLALLSLTAIPGFFSSYANAVAHNEETTKLRELKITAESVKINNDHDVNYEGEWRIMLYVNNQTMALWNGSDVDRVNNGDTIYFNKSLIIKVPENQKLRIVTAGVEYDSQIENFTNVSGLATQDTPFSQYVDLIQRSVEPLIAFDRNDAIGIVAKEYTKDTNFGAGKHDDCSEGNKMAGDLFDTADTICDFQLRYSIEQISK